MLRSELQQELEKPLDASDVLTPRGESMKAEVIHLRNLLHQLSFNQASLDSSHSPHSANEHIIHIHSLESEQSLNGMKIQMNDEEEEVEGGGKGGESGSSEGKHKDPRRILGVSDEEMKRNNAMKKLGITDEAYQEAAEIVAHSGVARGGVVTPEGKKQHSKTEELLGYTGEQQQRTKAVRKILGTSESTIEAERAEELGRVGRDDFP